MEAFKKRQITFLLQLIGVSAVLFGIHSYLLYHFASDMEFFFPVWQIYTFHLVVTLVLYTIINYRYSSGKTDIFNVFMVMTFLKMALAIVFLLPLILSDVENKQPDVFNFFIPYFLFLFFEVFTLTRFLQKE
ncbi:hypothetical protein [Winogradskyella flava]|uniref:Uncharacterized protein n=1 Tax=Winogradskyella flava TaxID=1884876 RepID=A0A842INP2_9FLAO|nr:hypothetical protein [Winogradskyella flava]MBC2843829.1 hypothetical protein [Winogradskyella flava]